MSGWDSAALVTELTRAHPGAGFRVSTGPDWSIVHPVEVRLPAYGWKLHISSRAATFEDLAARLVPFLLDQRCSFKLARDTAVLARMNEGRHAPAAVGKAITVYPDQSRVAELGLALARMARGHAGPRVLSDRRVDDRAPVYYRYGPFHTRWYAGERGKVAIGIPGPDGELFDAIATLTYQQPSWVDDPFRSARRSAGGSADAGRLLGGRYEVAEGIAQTAHGNVYRARDATTGQVVIVKQARAHVGEDPNGGDARTRLRNERRVLDAGQGIAGIPIPLDHFAHGADEFLVTTDAGPVNLLQRVRSNGALLPPAALAGSDQRTTEFVRLAAALAGTVCALHERGIIMRDITARNVVVGGDRPYLVDFGIACCDGLHPPGATWGFATDSQQANAPARFVDDCFGLGMTLAFAATGLIPIAGADSADLARARMLGSLAAIYPDPRAAFPVLVADLLSEDPAATGAALRVLAAGDWATPTRRRTDPPARTHRLDRLPSLSPGDTAALERQVRTTILAEASTHQLDQPESSFASVDASVYTGSPGIGLELLHHRHHDGVPDLLRRLASHALVARSTVETHPGLFLGSTGLLLFLTRMRAAGFDVELPSTPADAYHREDNDDDIITGTAGIALAYLRMAAVSGDLAWLGTARDGVLRLLSKPGMTMTVRPDGSLPESAGIDPATSYSHGVAGVVELMVSYAERTGDPDAMVAARAGARDLAARTEGLIGRAGAVAAVPMSVSWCQGLAGIGRPLLRAATLFDAMELAAPAYAAATVCAGWIPRMENLGRCCGVTGVGDFLIDCARHSGDDRYLAAAHRAAAQLLARSLGPDDAPRFIDPEQQDAPLSWAFGLTGILGFLRRLNRPDSPDPVVGDSAGPMPRPVP